MASRREKLIEGAKPYLDEGEEIRYVVSGQTGAPQGPIGALAIVVGRAKQRRVVVTDKHLYLLAGDFWGTTKSKGLVSKHPLGSIPTEYSGRRLLVGDQRIWIHPFAQGDAEEIGKLGAGPGDAAGSPAR